MRSTTAIAVVSEDRLIGEGVLRILADTPGFAPKTFHGAPALLAMGRRFDVALVDATMDGALAACAAASAGDGPAIIFICAPDDDGWAGEALLAGARGILPRTAAITDVAQAIRIVLDGGIWARRRWLNAWLQRMRGAGRTGIAVVDPRAQLDARLSDREREVFHHAAMGLSNKVLADILCISESTVKVHLTHIFRKLGLSGRGELAAAYHGLVTPPPAAAVLRDRAS